jgi:hypothetical protein
MFLFSIKSLHQEFSFLLIFLQLFLILPTSLSYLMYSLPIYREFLVFRRYQVLMQLRTRALSQRKRGSDDSIEQADGFAYLGMKDGSLRVLLLTVTPFSQLNFVKKTFGVALDLC